MNAKQIVLIGFIVTALLISITLTGRLPEFIIAFIILGISLAATYYIALNQKRIEHIEKLELLIKATRGLHTGMPRQNLVDYLLRWANHLVKSEQVFIWLAPENMFYPQPVAEWTGWEEINKSILQNSRTIIFNPGDTETEIANRPALIKNYMAVPLGSEEQIEGVLYLVNNSSEIFTVRDKELITAICGYISLCRGKSQAEIQKSENMLVIIKTLVKAIESLLPGYQGHAERVALVSKLIGKQLGVVDDEMEVLEYTALLHDIGKIRAEENSLNESGEILGDHAAYGAELLPVTGIFAEIKAGVKYHHERYDGSGYPEGRAYTEIPFNARIIAVADIYDAMTSLFPDEERLNHQAAIQVIKKATGSLFDPLVVVAMEEVADEIRTIYAEYKA
ncbi:MAG: HD domain-containing protein [Syntrophomonadaceae bacterium]|nr:HD domain-containing protein [Syntrophomonadaceae bacterium]MDD3890424.1 HD domain-containing protein [Syntrophomonadaceae bacterium]MDD4549175.1 HD domain-containing protein [Syntrophomonadaceae bacterium]